MPNELFIMPHAARTAVDSSPVQQNLNNAGLILTLRISSGSATGGLMPQIAVISPEDFQQEIVTRIPLPVRAVGRYTYHFYPGANRKGSSGNFFASIGVPESWFLIVTPDDASSITYSASVQYVKFA